MLSPVRVLKRGYALVYNEENKEVKSVDCIKEGERLNLMFYNGNIWVRAEKVEDKNG